MKVLKLIFRRLKKTIFFSIIKAAKDKQKKFLAMKKLKKILDFQKVSKAFDSFKELSSKYDNFLCIEQGFRSLLNLLSKVKNKQTYNIFKILKYNKIIKTENLF